MVKVRALLLFFMLGAHSLFAGEVDIDTRINTATAGENNPIEVMVIITREEGMEVDQSSFLLQDESVKVEHLGDSTKRSLSIINGRRNQENTTVGRYRFFLPGKPSGLYVLPQVKVKIDGQWYSSDSSSYQVKVGQETDDFRLEAAVNGPTTLYPGQSATFVYRIYFKDNIELTLEQLPLFENESFTPIGQKTVNSYVEGGFNVQEISQRVQPKEPGTFSFDKSVIEGYAYNQDVFGRKSYGKKRLRSVADPLTVTVKSFPQEGKPDTFTGSVGPFDVEVAMVTPPEVSVGDKVELAITFLGGDLSTVQLPVIERQKGFVGRFRFSDLPPVPATDATSRKYILELRPLKEDIKEIPSIAFSYFDPNRGWYRTVKSKAIPIAVKALQKPVVEEEVVVEPVQQAVVQEEKEDWREDITELKAIEIAGNWKIEKGDLESSLWSTWKALWLVPLGLAWFFVQRFLKRYLREAKKWQKKQRSRLLWHKAVQKKDAAILESALLLRLYEKGFVKKRATTPEELSREGLEGEVRSFLLHLQEERFAGVEGTITNEVLRLGRKLFERIR